MNISSIEIHNFKTFQDAKTTNIPDLAILLAKMEVESLLFLIFFIFFMIA